MTDAQIPPLVPVTSSNIGALGFDPAAKKLYVQFKAGALWVYHDVEETAHQALVEAESIGSHFGRFIRSKYRAEMLPAEQQPGSPVAEAAPAAETEPHPLADQPAVKDAP